LYGLRRRCKAREILGRHTYFLPPSAWQFGSVVAALLPTPRPE
jgi:hypothetical protein